MEDIKKIDWNPELSVDIQEIDEHQKKMFDLFNELIDLKKSKVESKEYVNMISKINEFARIYFNAEEKLLRKKGYPDLGDHSKAHRQFTKSFIALRREISSDTENLTFDVIDELRQWLIVHIHTLDSLYVPFLRINRYIEEAK